MKNIIYSALIGAGVALGLAVSGTAMASSLNYYLDMSNSASLFPSGTDYLEVTIDDRGLENDKIYFTVEALDPLTSIAGSNFGIDKFAFNGPKLASSEIDLSGWSLKNNKNVSIFGKFNNLISGGGNSRTSSLSFSIDAGNDTIASYAAALSDGSAFFAAHVAGFNIGCSNRRKGHEYDDGRSGEKHSSSNSNASTDSSNLNGGHCGCLTSAYFGGSKLDTSVPPNAVPVPPAAWLFASGLIGLVGVSRRDRRNIA
jgi:hypothetical protein